MNAESFDGKLITRAVARYLGMPDTKICESPISTDGGIVSMDVLGDIAVVEIASCSPDPAWFKSDIALIKQRGCWQVVAGLLN